jgi:hypothetical protein
LSLLRLTGGKPADFSAAKDNAAIKACSNEFTSCYGKREKALLTKQSVAGIKDPMLTTIEMDSIHAACTIKATADFVKAGGNGSSTTEFYKKAAEAAADAALNMGTGCFQQSFKRHKYDHMTVTGAQVEVLRAQCSKKAKQSYKRAGGNVTDFAIDSTRRRQRQVAGTAKGCKRNPQLCNNATNMNDYLDRGGMIEMANKDVLDGLAQESVLEFSECMRTDNNLGYMECMQDAEGTWMNNGGKVGGNFSMVFNEALESSMVADLRANPDYELPPISADVREQRQRQNGAQYAIAAVLTELPGEELEGDNHTATALDVFVRSGGNESLYYNALENAAEQYTAATVGACYDVASENCALTNCDNAEIDARRGICEKQSCDIYTKIVRTSSTRRLLGRKLSDAQAQTECEMAATTGQLRREALNTDNTNITGMEAFSDEIDTMRANQNFTTEDLRDTKNSFKLTITVDPDTDPDVLAKKLQDAAGAIGRNLGGAVGAADPCETGAPVISPGKTQIYVYGACVFRDVIEADTGQAQFETFADTKIPEAITSALPTTTRRLGGRNLAGITVKATSAKSKKNCKIGPYECPSSSAKIKSLSGGIIALILMVILCLCIGLAIIGYMLYSKRNKEQSSKQMVASPVVNGDKSQAYAYANPNPNPKMVEIPTVQGQNIQ